MIWALLVSLVGATPGCGAEAQPAREYFVTHRETLSYGGENGLAPYVFGTGLVVLEDGSLLAAYSRGAGHNVAGTYSVVRSGPSWGLSALDERVVARDDDARFSNQGPALARLGDGRLVLVYTRDQRTAPVTLPARTIWLRTSDDDGLTWSTPTEIVAPGSSFRSSSGPIVEVNGELVLPFYFAGADGLYHVGLMASVDGGATWDLRALIAPGSPGHQYSETAARVMPDGSLKALIRDDAWLGGTIWEADSFDGGSTWSSPTPAFPGMAWPSFVALANGDLVALNRRAAAGQDERVPVLRTKIAGVWGAERELAASGLQTYAALAVLPSGDVGGIFGTEWPNAAGRTTLEYVELRASTLALPEANVLAEDLGRPALTSTLAAAFDAEHLLRLRLLEGSATGFVDLDVWPGLAAGRHLLDDRGTGAANRFRFRLGSAAASVAWGSRRPGVVYYNGTSRAVVSPECFGAPLTGPWAVVTAGAWGPGVTDRPILRFGPNVRLAIDGSQRMYLRDAGTARITSAPLTSTRWVATGIFDGNRSRLRVNGREDSSGASAFGAAPLTSITLDATGQGIAYETRAIYIIAGMHDEVVADALALEAWLLGRERPE